MGAYQVVKDPHEDFVSADAPARVPPTVDLVVDGTNFTEPLPRPAVIPTLRELAHEVGAIARGLRERMTLRVAGIDEPWELGIERNGRELLVSLLQAGAELRIAYFQRAVDGRRFLATLTQSLEQARARATSGAACELEVACRALREALWVEVEEPGAPELVAVEPELKDVFGLSADIAFRRISERAEEAGAGAVEHADLVSLLGRGTLRVRVGERERSIPKAFIFLVLERLIRLGAEVLEAWEQGRSFFRRLEVQGIVIGLRMVEPSRAVAEPAAEPTSVWLTLGERRTSTGGAEPWTFRVASVPILLEAVLGFGRSYARALLRHDASQRHNLRLLELRRGLRDLVDRLEEATEDTRKVNLAPERYRAFAIQARASAPAAPPSKLRYAAGFATTIPGIDLRATFLCGEHVVVGAARETSVLDRQTGVVLWRHPTAPAVSVVTPLGLARLFADGSIALHEYETGEVKLTTRVLPRVGGAVTGAVVNAPELPKLLVVTEGDRHLSAIDLRSGQMQWRHSARIGRTFRLRRTGKLLMVAAGDATLSALDVASGEVVWRLCDRLRFTLPVGLDRDSVFAVAGDPEPRGRSLVRVHHIDPYMGETRWVRELPASAAPFGAPLLSARELLIVTRDRHGLGLLCLDRRTGEVRWSKEPGLAPVSSAWLILDDRVVFNCESGLLFALETSSGQTLWRHTFPRGLAGDQPRRLEPILRSGALFVPQQQVHVVRPGDGAVIGCVPTDLIPDLLRVDERCDVYVAEESGHLASFRAGPRLRLVS